MSPHTWFRCGCLSLVLPFLAVSVSTAADLETSETLSAEDELVREALHREIYGLQNERDRLLHEALEKNADCALAHWQLGFLQKEREWVSVETLVATSEASQLHGLYSAKRSALADTLDGHLDLANWCREKKLADEERAHLTRILDFHPDHALARERLGYRFLGGDWLLSEEFRAASERLRKQAAAAAKLRDELLAIRRDLYHVNSQQRASARQRLERIKNVHAIPAIESIISTAGQEGALAVVDAMSRCSAQEATGSLIRHAVLADSLLVRESAAERLRERQREAFVPAMLNEMYLSTSSAFELAPLANGQLGYRHAFSREGQDEHQLLILDTEYVRLARAGGDRDETLWRAFADSVIGMAQRQRAVAWQNFYQLTLNQRLSDALNIATSQQLPADPERWWAWWDEDNGVTQVGNKQVRVRQQGRQIAVADRRPPIEEDGSQVVISQPNRRHECFAAGTLVLTKFGPRPIETIRVGDTVLAQDIETGEIALKPVVRTTVRPAEPLVKIRVGQDAFETSEGHLFWEAGHGWRMAKKLQSGTPLHCLRGSLPITSIEPGQTDETYNLVVADYNTYFVGQHRILSHDVTAQRPTQMIVPGLRGE